MKSLLFFMVLSFSWLSQAKVVANYTYLKAKKPVKKNITIEEVKQAYTIVKKSVFNPPSPEKFFNEYIRFKMGVEVGLNQKKLVKSPDIENMISNPFLKQGFHDLLYRHLAELKLKNQMEKLDKISTNLSDSRLKKLYAGEPEYNIFFIAIYHPINPSPQQIHEAERRAKQIYAQVTKSKKPFLELVALYSDDKSNGTLGINRSRASIIPEVYTYLRRMRNGEISRPIRVPSGYFIVRLNRKIPFAEANKTAIRANYFNRERTKFFNSYFDGLKKDFKLNIVNRALIKTL